MPATLMFSMNSMARGSNFGAGAEIGAGCWLFVVGCWVGADEAAGASGREVPPTLAAAAGADRPSPRLWLAGTGPPLDDVATGRVNAGCAGAGLEAMGDGLGVEETAGCGEDGVVV